MKENKINLQELAALLAEKSNITKKDAEAFLKEYFSLIEESLIEDKSVKIKNLGTFKLAVVNERKSVNVNTGEDFIIPAHYKINFNADTQLAQQINEPFALFEATEIENDLLEEETPAATPTIQEEEIIPKPEVIQEEVEKEIVIIEEEIIVPKKEKIEEVIIEDKTEKTIEEIEEPAEEIEENPIVPIEEEEKTLTDENLKKRFPKWLLIIGILILLGLVGFAVYYFYGEDMRKSFSNKDHSASAMTIEEIKPEQNIENTTTVEADSVVLEAETVEPIEPLKARKIRYGETLRIVAEKELGSREFWVYIYIKNKSIIPNYNDVPVGMELIIPDKKEFGGINAADSASIYRAMELSKSLK